MNKIDTTRIIDKNEVFFINAIIRTKAHAGELYAKTDDVEGYQQIIDYCNALMAVIQEVTDEYVGNV